MAADNSLALIGRVGLDAARAAGRAARPGGNASRDLGDAKAIDQIVQQQRSIVAAIIAPGPQIYTALPKIAESYRFDRDHTAHGMGIS